MRDSLLQVMLFIVFLGFFPLDALYQNHWSAQKQEARVKEVVEEVIKDSKDFTVIEFVQLRYKAVIERCCTRISPFFLRNTNYCDREGTLHDHIEKEIRILRADFISRDRVRIDDIIPHVESEEYEYQESSDDMSLEWRIR